MKLVPATRPTFHFIGVTTAASSIMRVFPQWARHLGLDACIAGIDFPLHAPAADYRRAVEFLRGDPLSLGALVTTHKLDLFAACEDLFDDVDPHARRLRETSCLSKRDGRFACHAKDPITVGFAVDRLLPPGHFARGRAEGQGGDVLSMGAGGSTLALTWHLMCGREPGDRPARVVVTDRSPARLDEIRAHHAAWGAGSGVACEYVPSAGPRDNDAALAGLAPGAFVVNATGLGKDAPGSPLSDDARFPAGSLAWDLNYRGELVFLRQARAQAAASGLRVEDGWAYFLYGWTRVMAEVFHIELPVAGPGFERLGQIAADAGKPAPHPSPAD